jgi:hypothetical protein
MEKSDEIMMLFRNCREDERFLRYILEDYLRLRNSDLESKVNTCLKNFDNLMRGMWKKEFESKEAAK